VEGAALLGRLTWQLAEVVDIVPETAGVKTLALDVPEWPGHRAGQHVDIRLTAEDGYQAERSYSIASAPDDGKLELTVERIDEGADFSGSGPVYALGSAVITNAGWNAGWPGGGWITYRLTDGPGAGLTVYLAEDVTPTVQPGQRVSASTVIANMFNWGDGIEIGWAQASGVSAESELPEAGGIGGAGPFPTSVGVNFDELLHSLGVPAAPNLTEPAYGLLPSNYPTRW